MFGSLTKQILRLINHFLSSFCADARKLILQISFVMLTDKWEQKAKFFKSPPTSDATLLALHPRILKNHPSPQYILNTLILDSVPPVVVHSAHILTYFCNPHLK